MAKWYDDMQRELNKNKMQYPQEFIDKVLINFPEDEEMKALLEEKSFLLGAYIHKISAKKISVEELTFASENGTMDELVKRGNQIKAAKELYSDFIDLYDEQYRSKGRYILNGLDCSSDEVLRDYQLRHGQIELVPFKVDPIAERISDESIRLRLEQNAERRRIGEEIAKNMWCGGPGSRL